MAVRVMDLRQSRRERAALRADREAHPCDDRRPHRGRQHARGVRLGAAADRALLRGARGRHRRRAARRPRARAAPARRAPAPGPPVRDAHGARRPAAGRRLRRGAAACTSPTCPATCCWTSPASTPGTRRTSATTATRAIPSTASTSSTARATSSSSSTAATLAETRAPALLFETQLPTRFYLPPGDVDLAAFAPSEKHSWCAYKGQASYWSLPDAADVAWFYPEPLREAAEVKDMIAFWDERVDVIVDGERRGRPKTHWYG